MSEPQASFLLPTDEIKAAAREAKTSFAALTETLADLRRVVAHVSGITEDLHAITTRLRAVIAPPAEQG